MKAKKKIQFPQFLMAEAVIEEIKKFIPVDEGTAPFYDEMAPDLLVDALACAGLSFCIANDASLEWIASFQKNPEEYLAKARQGAD